MDPLVLCYHGILDNAGTFDRIIPYLPKVYYYVCIDLPGHGKSSFLPPQVTIDTLNFLLAYKYISKYFRRKCIFLGHSYGGQICYLYTQLYPEEIEKLIMLDTIALFPVSVNIFKDAIREKIDSQIRTIAKMATGIRPTYTKEEALNKLHTGRSYAPIKIEGAKALLERAIEETGDGRYAFTMDPRIKNIFVPLRDMRLLQEHIKHYPLRCPLLIVLGTESTAQQVYFSSVIQILKKRKNVKIKYVEGNHDVHNDYAERVAPIISKFLLYTSSKI